MRNKKGRDQIPRIYFSLSLSLASRPVVNRETWSKPKVWPTDGPAPFTSAPDRFMAVESKPMRPRRVTNKSSCRSLFSDCSFPPDYSIGITAQVGYRIGIHTHKYIISIQSVPIGMTGLVSMYPPALFRFYSDTYVQPDCISNSLNHMHSTLVDIWTHIRRNRRYRDMYTWLYMFVRVVRVSLRERTDCVAGQKERERKKGPGVFYFVLSFFGQVDPH